MPIVTLPDGSRRDYSNPLTVAEVAADIGAGLAKSAYVAAQGTALKRAGRVYLRKLGDDVWVGGHVVDVVRGEIAL